MTATKHIHWYERAKLELKRARRTYSDLAIYLGVETSTVGHWMTGRNKPRLETIMQIAKYLDLSLAELTGEDRYFIIDDQERTVIDALRALPDSERRALIHLLQSAASTTKETPSK